MVEMSNEMTGLEILQEAERIVLAFHKASIEQNAPNRYVEDMAICARVLRGLITVGEGLEKKDNSK